MMLIFSGCEDVSYSQQTEVKCYNSEKVYNPVLKFMQHNVYASAYIKIPKRIDDQTVIKYNLFNWDGKYFTLNSIKIAQFIRGKQTKILKDEVTTNEGAKLRCFADDSFNF